MDTQLDSNIVVFRLKIGKKVTRNKRKVRERRKSGEESDCPAWFSNFLETTAEEYFSWSKDTEI